MKLGEAKRLGEKRLRELGLTLHDAWRCVEHGECPEGVDPVDVEESFWAYVDAVEALERRSIIGELEHRYMEELEAGKKRQKLPVPA